MKTLDKVSLLAILFALAACGGDDVSGGADASVGGDANGIGGSDGGVGGSDSNTGSNSACPDIEGCGGSPLGQWKVEETCVDLAGQDVIPSCEDEIVSSDLNFAGTMEFEADETFSANLILSGTITIVRPAACVTGVTSCALFEGNEGTTCTGTVDDQCTCIIEVSDTQSETGTWSVSGNSLTLDDEPGTFCQDGNLLTISGSAEGGATSIVFSRM